MGKIIQINSDFEISLYLSILAILLAVFYIFYFLTRFERVITVKELYGFGTGSYKYSSVQNIIQDTDGNVYSVRNNFLILLWNAYEIYGNFEVGKSYRVTGYGIRFLWLLPSITSVVAE